MWSNLREAEWKWSKKYQTHTRLRGIYLLLHLRWNKTRCVECIHRGHWFSYIYIYTCVVYCVLEHKTLFTCIFSVEKRWRWRQRGKCAFSVRKHKFITIDIVVWLLFSGYARWNCVIYTILLRNYELCWMLALWTFAGSSSYVNSAQSTQWNIHWDAGVFYSCA